METDLSRLRRFALATGVVLLTYAVAAVELDLQETVRPLGVPLRIRNPEWLGIGIALAALYGMLRFTYYGVMIEQTPLARRRRRLAEDKIGPGFAATGTLDVPEENRQQLTEHFQGMFPRVPGAPISLLLRQPPDTARDVQETLDFEPVPVVDRLMVPARVRFAMWLEQADYTAPIWFNALALVVWACRVTLG